MLAGSGRPRRMGPGPTVSAAVLGVGLLLIGCAGNPPSASQASGAASPPASPSVSAAPSGVPTTKLQDRQTAEVDIVGADYPIAAFGSLWVVAADRPKPAVVRVDPKTNQTMAEILVPGRNCNGLTAGFGSVWACSADGIARIDPATNKISSLVDVPAVGQNRLAATDDSIWAFTSASGFEPATALLRINPRTEKAQTIPLGHDAAAMAVADGALWVTSTADGLLLRVDADGTVTTALEGLAQPFYVSAGLGSLWVSLHGTEDAAPAATEPTVIRVDPQTLEVQAEIAAGAVGRFGEVAADETGLWVRSATTFLARFDANTYAPVEVIDATKGGGSVIVAFDAVWASSFDFGHVWRIDP